MDKKIQKVLTLALSVGSKSLASREQAKAVRAFEWLLSKILKPSIKE
jgi:hypothetical protein